MYLRTKFGAGAGQRGVLPRAEYAAKGGRRACSVAKPDGQTDCSWQGVGPRDPHGQGRSDAAMRARRGAWARGTFAMASSSVLNRVCSICLSKAYCLIRLPCSYCIVRAVKGRRVFAHARGMCGQRAWRAQAHARASAQRSAADKGRTRTARVRVGAQGGGGTGSVSRARGRCRANAHALGGNALCQQSRA